jgi:hypothetical protein
MSCLTSGTWCKLTDQLPVVPYGRRKTQLWFVVRRFLLWSVGSGNVERYGYLLWRQNSCLYTSNSNAANQEIIHNVHAFHKPTLVKCTLLQALRICTGRTAYRGSRGIALSFHDHSTRRGWGVNVTPRPLFTTGKDPVPIVQEAEWAPGPVWTGAEKSRLRRDSFPGPSSP